MSVFSSRLCEARKNNNLTQKELAEILNITPTRLNFWEKAKREPKIEMILKIASVLNVSADYLIGIPDNSTCNIENITHQEAQLIVSYREHPQMQDAVNKKPLRL